MAVAHDTINLVFFDLLLLLSMSLSNAALDLVLVLERCALGLSLFLHHGGRICSKENDM